MKEKNIGDKNLIKSSKHILIQMRDLRMGNGIASCIMSYYEYTIKKGYTIDFLLNRNIDSCFMKIVRRNNSKIYVLPKDTGKPNKENIRYMKNIITNGYDIIHVNISGFNALSSLYISKKCSIETRIYHAHNPKETSSYKARIRSLIYENPSVWLANKYVACSSYAGKSVFGRKKFEVLKNSIDTNKFLYDTNARKDIRSHLGIDNKFVIGVVGRLAEQKNPYFIIDIFEFVKNINKDSVLIWAGDGNLKNDIQKYINSKGISDSVLLLGSRNDVNKLYSAMDVFLLPSKFEGFGLVYIEAQVSGLQCFGSNKIPEDINISDNMHRINLNKSPKFWANQICNCNISRISAQENAINSGFDIFTQLENLSNIYK